MGAGPHDYRPTAGFKCRMDARTAQNKRASREIRTMDEFHQAFDGDFRVIDIGHAAVNNFTKVMRRNVGCHTNRNTTRTIDQHVGKTCWQNRWFLGCFVIVVAEIDGVFIDIFEQEVRGLGHAGFGVTHGGGFIAIHGPKVALPVDQLQAHGEALRHTNHRVVNRAVAVRMVFTHHVPDDTGRFTEWLVIVKTVFMHGVQNTSVHRFQTVSDVRQRTADDHAHCVIEIASAHFLFDGYRENIAALGIGLFGGQRP